jgi:O-antigen/teichoic acid export membrane protein
MSRVSEKLRLSSTTEFGSLVTTVAKGASIALGGSLLGRGMEYSGQFLMARVLGPRDFGLYSLAIVVATLLSTVARIGLEGATTKLIPTYIAGQQWRRLKGMLVIAAGLPTALGVLLGGVLYIFSGYLAMIFDKPDLAQVLKFAAFLISPLSILISSATATRGFQVTQYYVYSYDLTWPMAKILLFITGYSLGLKVYDAIAATVISAGLAALLALRFLRKLYFSMNGDGARTRAVFPTGQIGSVAVPLFFSGLLSFGLVWGDSLILGYFRPIQEVGVYGIISQTALLFMLIINALSSIFAPTASKLWALRDMESLNRLFETVTRWALYLATPVVIVLSVGGKGLLDILGEGYSDGYIPLLILGWGYYGYVVLGQVGWLLIACDRQMWWLWDLAAAIALKLALSVILIPWLGMSGAALSTVASILGLNVLGLIQAYHILKKMPFSKRVWIRLLAGFIGLTAGFGTRQLDFSEPLGTLISSLTGIGTYAFLLIVWGLESQERSWMGRAIRLGMSLKTGRM